MHFSTMSCGLFSRRDADGSFQDHILTCITKAGAVKNVFVIDELSESDKVVELRESNFLRKCRLEV